MIKTLVKYMIFTLSVTILLTGLIVSDSYALHELFKSIDLNKDEKIDRKELAEDMKKNAFDKLDTDDNMIITEEEWNSFGNITEHENYSSLFKRVDRDRDRRITFFEFSDYAEKNANLEAAFIGLDKDKSNYLSPDEITIRPLFRMFTIYF